MASASVLGTARATVSGDGAPAADVGWAALALAMLAGAVATPLVVRRRRNVAGQMAECEEQVEPRL
jgi:hypothetical protein